ncbi:MAG: dipeptide ABC transporter ATP-binding protein [Desulfohalobiaceae bacterium]|nr:dipeptide ABC transporter ATP-binding protein [Desulfohalobiaceae bacterium]
MTENILSAEQLSKHYPIKEHGLFRSKAVVRAVEEVSLEVEKGEVFGLVGESGCGKSSLGRVLLRLEEPSAGRVLFQGQDLVGFDRSELKAFRRQAQIIYQDPYSALNPRQRIQDLVREPLDIHGLGTGRQRSERVSRLLEKVGLRPDHASRYPHEFSGGQRQRIVIARALALNPKLILADEAVSALDVSIQAQVINLLKDLRQEFTLTYIFISHDLSVIKHIADRVGVMYLGRLVEVAPKRSFYQEPKHPYSRALLSSAPVPDPRARRQRIILAGDVPSPVNPPSGCSFHPRCPQCLEMCKDTFPPLRQISPQRYAACHLY